MGVEERQAADGSLYTVWRRAGSGVAIMTTRHRQHCRTLAPTPISRRGFFTASSAAAAAWACGGNEQTGRPETTRPNILFLFPDQMRGMAMGCMGDPDVKTPNLDRLASEGVLLRNTFANSPVCCPARATILTGKYTHANGMVANDLRLRESETTIAEILAQAGYRTGFIGKWHLDGGPRLPGFIPPGPRRQGFEFWAANEVSHRHFDSQYFRDTSQPIPIKTFEAEVWADLGIEFLRGSRNDQRPFFLTIQMGPPHDPYIAPENYTALYDPGAITLRPNHPALSGGNPSSTNLPGRKEIATYYAMISAVDEQIGRVLESLDDLGLAQNTIVLVSSDHGDMLGSQGARLKRKPWEESIRVPGIVRFPGRAAPGRTTDALFSHVDFAPTLLSLCGVGVPAGMQGSDLSAVILGDAETGPDSVYFQIFGPYEAGGVKAGWRGIRTNRYMYARYESEPWVLYDLERDPHELANLATEPAAREFRTDLEARLGAWMSKTGDSWNYNWTAPVEDKGRLYKHETFYTVDEYLAWAKQHPEAEP